MLRIAATPVAALCTCGMLATCGSAEQPSSSEASEQRPEASAEPPPREALGELLERNRREGEAAVAAPPAPRAVDPPEDDPLVRIARR